MKLEVVMVVILSLVFHIVVKGDTTADKIIAKIFEIGNIYSYNESFTINQLSNADYYIPISSTNCSKYDQRDGFHFDGILGYIFEQNEKTCLRKCCGFPNCKAVNYVSIINWCVLLASYAPQHHHPWSGVKSKHLFFAISGSTKNKDYSNSQIGILPNMLGQSYFTPIGLNTETRRRRILGGGEVSRPFSLPWSAFVETFVRNESNVKLATRCTGFLVANDPDSTIVGESSNKVITAAHCFDIGAKENIIITLGSHRRDVIEAHEVQLGVKTIIIHPRYQRLSSNPFDIALVILEKPVYFSEYIRPVALPSTSLTKSLDNIIWLSAGWGHVSWNGNPSMELQQSTVHIGSCATFPEPTALCLTSVTPAEGDSGSALLAYDVRTRQFTATAVLAGIFYHNSLYTDIEERNERWIVKKFAAADASSCSGYETIDGCFRPCDTAKKTFDLPQILTTGARIRIIGTVTNGTKDFVIRFLTDSEQKTHFLKIQLKFSDSEDSYGQMSQGRRKWITNPQRFAYGTSRVINVVLERTTVHSYRIFGQQTRSSAVVPQHESAKDFNLLMVLFNGGNGTIDQLCYDQK